MFGFIRPPCRSCASANADAYRPWFCGLGCALARDYTPLARFLVNHDSSFLAIAAATAEPAPSTMTVRTCCNPLRHPKPVYSDTGPTRYAAAVTMCALRVKAEDEADDEHGFRKQFGRAAKALATPAAEKATAFLNTIGFPCRDTWQNLKDRSACETPKAGLREAASPTADAYRTIFRFPGELHGAGRRKREQLSQLGESFGRLVYWQDALDDRESDATQGRYNPLAYHREGRLAERFDEESIRFRSAAASLDADPKNLLSGLAENSTSATGETDQQRRKRKRKDREGCCDWCLCCESPSCTSSRSGAAAGTAGAPDSGCTDCACDGCGCDSCDCPCN